MISSQKNGDKADKAKDRLWLETKAYHKKKKRKMSGNQYLKSKKGSTKQSFQQSYQTISYDVLNAISINQSKNLKFETRAFTDYFL